MGDTRQPLLGDLIRQYRTSVGLTQQDLARAASVSPSYVYHLERGSRKHPTAVVLARITKSLRLNAKQTADVYSSIGLTYNPPHSATAPSLAVAQASASSELLYEYSSLTEKLLNDAVDPHKRTLAAKVANTIVGMLLGYGEQDRNDTHTR